MKCPNDGCDFEGASTEFYLIDGVGNCPKCKRMVYGEDNSISKKEIDYNKSEVPSLDLIDFSEYFEVFKDTHKHLPCYDLVKKEMGLEGEEYYVIEKAWAYRVESLRQDTVRFPIGKEWTDNRIHVLCVGGAGTGKGILKNAIRLHNNSKEISGARTNLEQLIGKFDKKGNENEGYFRKKALDCDEAHTLITEEDKNLGGVMREFRIAMDIFGMNTVDKKNVDAKQFLSFCPETRMAFYSHDTILPPVFFDLGTARRLFAFELKPMKVEEDSATKGLLIEANYTNELKEYINTRNDCGGVSGFSPEGIKELVFWVKCWNKFCLTHSNQRIRILGRRLFFSGKIYFMRMATILGCVRGETLISQETVKQACFDCVHFLLSTLQVYGNKSVLTLSRDIWKTSDQKEAMFLEWLHYQGAVSRETSNVMISQCQEKIGDIFGINDRQSRSVYGKLKKSGFVHDYKGQDTSKVWLGFNPNLEEFVSFNDNEAVNMLDLLFRVRIELEWSEWRERQSTPPLSLLREPSPTTTISIITPKELYHSNHSQQLTINNKNEIKATTEPKIGFLTKADLDLVDGEPRGRCSGCGCNELIVAVNNVKRRAYCEKCYEGLP